MPSGYNKYISQQGQSLDDVCLNTYGSLDFKLKLAVDNNSATLNYAPIPGTIFEYDPSLVVSQVLQQRRNTYVTYQPLNAAIPPIKAFINEDDTTIIYVFVNEESNGSVAKYFIPE